jgi:hypothetical protein
MFPMTPWVKRLLIANVAMALVTGRLIGPVLGGLGRDIETLLLLYPPAVLYRPWTVVTYMFLHAGAAHLFFNMIGLIFFGPRLESRLGSKGFLLLYLVSGLGGAAFSLVFARLTPVERRATSSLSDDSRPIAISTPNSSAIGIVSTRMLGIASARSSPTTRTGKPRRMIISAESNRASSSRMNV